MPARCVQIPADEQRHDAYWSIVSDLVSLIDRTRGYQWVNELFESPRSWDSDVVVLDDVTPPQADETSSLSDCNLRLCEALRFFLEARAAFERCRGVTSH